MSNLHLDRQVATVVDFIAARGYVFEPWQIAAFITAARTKPFVILAGISGTGKSKLPRLVAEATESGFVAVPVRPDWSDSSELIGYERIDGTFVPGYLLKLAKHAIEHPEQQHFLLLDEMNIARVEYYLAEVLSLLEERTMDNGKLRSKELAPAASDRDWSSVYIPENLCIVGSVNMDETTHAFSKKVLDRSFVIEFSDVDLAQIGTVDEQAESTAWSAEDWRPAYLTLAEHPLRDNELVHDVVDALITINSALIQMQLQVGYRVRDEIALFCLNAAGCASSFVFAGEGAADPLDLAIAMKVLPRVQGGGVSVHTLLESLASWANARDGVSAGSQSESGTRSFPTCGERIDLMQRRLSATGFTSYWL